MTDQPPLELLDFARRIVAGRGHDRRDDPRRHSMIAVDVQPLDETKQPYGERFNRPSGERFNRTVDRVPIGFYSSSTYMQRSGTETGQGPFPRALSHLLPAGNRSRHFVEDPPVVADDTAFLQVFGIVAEESSDLPGVR